MRVISAGYENEKMQRKARPEQRRIGGGQRRYTTPSPLRNLQQRRRQETEKRRRERKRFDWTPEWAEGEISRRDQRDGVRDRYRGSGRERALGCVRLDREPPLYPTLKRQVGKELDPEFAPRRRRTNPAGGCVRKGDGKYHRSERIKRKRDPSLSPRRTKSEIRLVKRRTEPEGPTGEEPSHFGVDVGEAHDGRRKAVRWAVPHAGCNFDRANPQSSSSRRGRRTERDTATRPWRLGCCSTKEDSSSEGEYSEGEEEKGEIRTAEYEAKERACSPSDVSASSSDEDDKSRGRVENEAASPEETEDEAEEARGEPLCPGAESAGCREALADGGRQPVPGGAICVGLEALRKANHVEPTPAPPPSPVDATEQDRGAESERSLRPGEIDVPESEEGVEVAKRMDEELHTAIWSISGQPNPSRYYLTSTEDEEYGTLEEEASAMLCESVITKAYDDINLITYPDCIEPRAAEPPNGYQVPPRVASTCAETIELPGSLLPPPETGDEDLDHGGDGRPSSQPDVEPPKDEPGAALQSESPGLCLSVESNRREPRTPAEEELACWSAEGSAGPRPWDGIPGVSLSTLEDLITCPSCRRVFNRAPVCCGYLLQLNRPVQCLCGCVLCTLCIRAQGGCRKHWVVSENGMVNATANALADMPEMEAVGAWELEREGSDRFMTRIEKEECVERMLAEGSPSDEELQRAFQTLIKNPANDMSFTYWENKLLPEYDAYRYVCMPHIPGFWDRVLVGKWCPESTQAAIGPDVHLPRLFDVDMGTHYFHWCCFVFKEQIVLAAWCTTRVCQGGSMRVLPLIDSSLRETVSEVKFKRMIFLLRTWFTVQYRSREGGGRVERDIHVVLDCKPLDGPTIVQAIAELAARSGMEKADPSYVHKRVRPFALDADVFSAKNAAAAALFDYRPLSCCQSQTLYMNVAEEFSDCHRNSETGNTLTRPICYEGDKNVYV
ncbi:uncharacterized protein LOC144994583 [Oryzias latipes]